MTQLVWGDFGTNWHPVRATVPYRLELLYITGMALMSAGLAVQWRRTNRAGLIALGVLYLLAALLWLPRMIGFPELFGVWSGFAEQFSMVVAVVLTLAATRAGEGTTSATMRGARFMFGLCVLAFGMAHFTALEETARMVPAWVPPGQRFWAIATGAAMFLAGMSLMAGILAVQAAWSFTALLMSFGVFVWAPRLFLAPHKHNTWAGNSINLAMAAGAWMVADVLTRASTGRRRRDCASRTARNRSLALTL
jgi:uncharacterized membrane protein